MYICYVYFVQLDIHTLVLMPCVLIKDNDILNNLNNNKKNILFKILLQMLPQSPQ